MYSRPQYNTLLERLKERRKFIQILLGPRQVGKTTLSQQILKEFGNTAHYASADLKSVQNSVWINQQWTNARLQGKELLILDEIQKIKDWSDTVKALWDEDTIKKSKLKILLLGSSSLLIQKGLSESLGGRFEKIYLPHWSYREIHAEFGLGLQEYFYFGAYPGAMALTANAERFRNYINDSLIESTVSKDILQMTEIRKPALLKNLMELGVHYSGQIFSFQKMLGSLQDVGNVTTLSHYLELLEDAGLLMGLQKFSCAHHRKRLSSPKFQVLNTAIMTAQSGLSFEEWKNDGDKWGRLVESAVGAHLVNQSYGSQIKVYYWRERGDEVDFVLEKSGRLVALEVKSGVNKTINSGIRAFIKEFNPHKVYLIGGQGIALEDFFNMGIERFFV